MKRTYPIRMRSEAKCCREFLAHSACVPLIQFIFRMLVHDVTELRGKLVSLCSGQPSTKTKYVHERIMQCNA